ncbi:MAG TPA: arginase family protein, partial [Actinomycetota bacterium]
MSELRVFDLWGVPFDGGATLGWPGARNGPDRVRRALSWMAMREEEGLVRAVDPGEDLPVPEVADRGDVDVVPHDLMATIDAVSDAVTGSVTASRVPIVVGGEDSLFFPSVRGLHDAVEGSVGVIHFDAHFDLLDENRRQGRFSHSSGMRRSLELERVAAGHCVQVGTRTFNFPSSAAFVEKIGLLQIPAVEVHEQGVTGTVERVLERVGGVDHVFWSLDIDVIDPAH